jgi:hypothetical protein
MVLPGGLRPGLNAPLGFVGTDPKPMNLGASSVVWQRQVVTVSGQAFHQGSCLLAAIFNTRTQGSGPPAVPDARINDERFN